MQSKGTPSHLSTVYARDMITLYHCKGARSTRSLWLLNELGLDFELVELPFDPRKLRTPEYLAISPLARVPALVDDGVTIFESGAICEYLCETYDKDAKLWRRPGDPERAEWLQWLHFAETVAAHASNLVQQNVIIAEPDRSPIVNKLESRRLEKTYGVLDDHLAEREYLLRSGFSAVDTSVGFSVVLGRNFVPTGEFSNLTAYYERCVARPAFQKSL